MNFKDNAHLASQNFDNSNSSKKPHPVFEQSLPATAPVLENTPSFQKRKEKIMTNIPDWRNEDEIIIEAARHDSSIKLPERLRPRLPKIIEGRTDPAPKPGRKTKKQENLHPSKTTPGSEQSSYNANLPKNIVTDPSLLLPSVPPGTTPPPGRIITAPAPSFTPAPHPGRTAHQSGRTILPTLTEIVLRTLGNLALLMVPTLCVLLLSGWGPEEISIIFEDFWSYLGLSVLITLIVVILDFLNQSLAKRLKLGKPLEWLLEFGFSALGAGICLFFFTHSVLGALLLALIMSVLISLFSATVAKLF